MAFDPTSLPIADPKFATLLYEPRGLGSILKLYLTILMQILVKIVIAEWKEFEKLFFFYFEFYFERSGIIDSVRNELSRK